MYGWSLAARTMDEVERVLRALERHRYLAEVDHSLHWSVVVAVAEVEPSLQEPRAAWRARSRGLPDLELDSRDERLWLPVSVEQAVAVLRLMWTGGEQAALVTRSLTGALRAVGIEAPGHEPFASLPDEPPHPELLRLDWVLLPVDQLDVERHAGALGAMADSGEAVAASEPVYLEGPTLSEVELCAGAPRGVLPTDFMVWADGPYRYCDYVLRGVARAATLVEAPLGYRDVDGT